MGKKIQYGTFVVSRERCEKTTSVKIILGS